MWKLDPLLQECSTALWKDMSKADGGCWTMLLFLQNRRCLAEQGNKRWREMPYGRNVQIAEWSVYDSSQTSLKARNGRQTKLCNDTDMKELWKYAPSLSLLSKWKINCWFSYALSLETDSGRCWLLVLKTVCILCCFKILSLVICCEVCQPKTTTVSAFCYH